MFCKKCGAKIESYASHCPFCGVAVEQNSVEATYTAPKGKEKKKQSKGVAKRVIFFLVCVAVVVGAVALALFLLK